MKILSFPASGTIIGRMERLPLVQVINMSALEGCISTRLLTERL